MTAGHRGHRALRVNRQAGMATLLIILLAGLALTATALGVAHVVRGSQEKALTTHLSTTAQARAWTGVELLRQYLLTRTDAQMQAMTAGTAVAVTGTAGLSMSIVSIAGIAAPYTVTADVTATVNNASSTVRAVYSTTPATSAPSGGGVCGQVSPAALVFNGNVGYSGGSLVITDGDADFTNVAIGGTLTVGSGASAKISGCATGDISLSGGGVEPGASLTSGGTITINSMSEPDNATLWAKNIINNQYGGTFTAVKAGAYAAKVYSGTTEIGTANVGGTIIGSTAGSPIPWTTGTIVPPGSGYIVITLTSGATFLVKMSSVTIDTSTGAVTGATAASEVLSGSGTLPDSLLFKATSIYGGTVTVYNNTATTLWGHNVTANNNGGIYSNLYSNGDLKIGASKVTSLRGGGLLWASDGGYNTPTNYWNFPTVSAGTTAGSLYYGSSKTLISDSTSLSTVNVARSVSGTSPGLPGVPFCDTRVQAVDVDLYQDDANYIFYFDTTTSHPMLKIQNLKSGSTTISEGPYDLTTTDLRTLNGKPFMQCGWYNSHCFRDSSTSTSKGWTLSGVYEFPPGVAWFDRALTIDGVDSNQPNLYDSFLAVGDVKLTSSGHVPIYAPNYSTPALICDGDFYPTQLCNKTTSPSTFATWTDSSGVTHTGLPIGNVALATEGSLTVSGWEIHGNVMLGKGIDTSGATSTFYGTLQVGSNQTSTTTIAKGGIKIITTGLTEDQMYMPDPTNCTAGTTPVAASSSVLWTTYQ